MAFHETNKATIYNYQQFTLKNTLGFLKLPPPAKINK